MSQSDVQKVLALHLIDRASWLFYKHDEANIIDY